MEIHQRVLFVDVMTGFYRLTRFPLGPFYGPVDLGLHLAGKFNSLNLGVDLSGIQPTHPDRILPVPGRILRLLHGGKPLRGVLSDSDGFGG